MKKLLKRIGALLGVSVLTMSMMVTGSAEEAEKTDLNVEFFVTEVNCLVKLRLHRAMRRR